MHYILLWLTFVRPIRERVGVVVEEEPHQVVPLVVLLAQRVVVAQALKKYRFNLKARLLFIRLNL